MTRCLGILFLIPLSISASGPSRPIFAFEADSLKATLTPMGGGGAAAPDSSQPGWRIACDSAIHGAWFEVEVVDKRSGAVLRFPADEAALRLGLRQACQEGAEAPPERVASGLKAMARKLRVRMGGQGAEAAE